MVNRHIKEKALIPLADDRGNHPIKGSVEYNLMIQRRGFHMNTMIEEEVEKQKQKTAFRKSEYAEKRKLSDRKKVEEVYHNLQ